MKKVLLISGKIHCGKNQFAEYLVGTLRQEGFKVSTDLFARSLKDGCKEDFRKLVNVLDNISEEIKSKIYTFIDGKEYMKFPSQVEDIDSTINKLKIKDENWYEDKTDITRNILQLYGTEIFRKRVDNDWWVNQVKNRAIDSDDDFIVVTDCRFPNEITEMFCDEYETYVIRITRNINTQEQIANHDSETSLDNWKEWNYVVENNGTLEDLKESAKVIVNDLIEKKENSEVGLFTRI